MTETEEDLEIEDLEADTEIEMMTDDGEMEIEIGIVPKVALTAIKWVTMLVTAQSVFFFSFSETT